MPFGPEDDDDDVPLGQETWDAVEELTDAQENDPDAYQAWSDTTSTTRPTRTRSCSSGPTRCTIVVMNAIPQYNEIEQDLLRDARQLVAVMRMSQVEYAKGKVVVHCAGETFRNWLRQPKLRAVLQESLERHLGAGTQLVVLA